MSMFTTTMLRIKIPIHCVVVDLVFHSQWLCDISCCTSCCLLSLNI